jgi:hypothetical protein
MAGTKTHKVGYMSIRETCDRRGEDLLVSDHRVHLSQKFSIKCQKIKIGRSDGRMSVKTDITVTEIVYTSQ